MPKILLKLSGESLAQDGTGVDGATVQQLALQLAAVNKNGVALAIVIGGGNLWRFRDNADKTFLPRTQSDYLGMLATVMNGAVLAAALRAQGVEAQAWSAIPAPNQLAEPYRIDSAQDLLARGGVAILTGGTSNPYFTTDSAAALRAVELECDQVWKATNVEGVYDSDPKHNPTAKLLSELSFAEVLTRELKVMDSTAFALLAEHRIPLLVFNFDKLTQINAAATRPSFGTLIS